MALPRRPVLVALLLASALSAPILGRQEPVAQGAYLKASDTMVDQWFGDAVAVSGNTLVVGAWGATSGMPGGDDAGAAYVFVRQGGAWVQEARLEASNANPGDRFGTAVAISGDTIAVGASGERSRAPGVNGVQSDNSYESAGAAYVFVRDGSTWTQEAYLKSSHPDREDFFGSAIAVDGDTVVVGAWGESSAATGVGGDASDDSAVFAGAAFVFVRNGTTWAQQAYLKASNTGQTDLFGSALAISGDTIVVGAHREDSSATGVDGDELNDAAGDSGAAYVFVRQGTAWSQEAYLKASNTDPADRFAWSLALSGDTLVAGAPWEDSAATGVDGNQQNDGATRAGAAYVLVRDGSTWTQEAYLKASNTGASDSLGLSVAVSGDAIVAGAIQEASDATGVNGDPYADALQGVGAAYLYARVDGRWSQMAYLKPSNAGFLDSFGTSSALDGDLLVVGAPRERSAAHGVDGDQTNDDALDAGAAYLFEVGLSNDTIGVNRCGPDVVVNTAGRTGAILATGSTDVDDEDLHLLAFGLPPGNVCLFLASPNPAFVPTPGTSCGNLCLGAGLVRFTADSGPIDAAGQFALQVDPFAVPTNPPQPILAGQTWHFQAWHRDSAALPACNNNFTDATEVTFGP